MTHLYNCKSNGDEWRITKFTENLELVEGSSYLCTLSECQCPAGVRPTCRHREMLPKFFHREFVDTGYFFDYDRGGWVDMRTEDEVESEPSAKAAAEAWLSPNEILDDIPYIEVQATAPAKWRRF